MKIGDRVKVFWIVEETENLFKVIRFSDDEIVLRMIPGPRDDVPDGDETFVRRGDDWCLFDDESVRVLVTPQA